MSTITTERRIQGLELRDVETTESLSMMRATAVPYGRDADIGWFLEQFEPGSLAKSIKEAAADLPLLLFHDNRSFPIGAADSWKDDATELEGTWRLDGSEEAQRAAELAKPKADGGKGMLGFMSIGFTPIRSRWEYVEDRDWNPDLGPDHKDRVFRQEARLLEVSLVSTPAYKDAAVKLVRSAPPPRRQHDRGRREVQEWRAELERMRSGLLT